MHFADLTATHRRSLVEQGERPRDVSSLQCLLYAGSTIARETMRRAIDVFGSTVCTSSTRRARRSRPRCCCPTNTSPQGAGPNRDGCVRSAGRHPTHTSRSGPRTAPSCRPARSAWSPSAARSPCPGCGAPSPERSQRIRQHAERAAGHGHPGRVRQHLVAPGQAD